MIKIEQLLPLVFKQYNYVAQQPNGKWCAYGSEPELRKDCWIAHSSTIAYLSDVFSIEPVDDWTQSLRKVGNYE